MAWPVYAGEDSDSLPPWMDLAGPPDPADRVIQKRKFELEHEFSFMIGELPADPFYKGITLSASYTLHFSNYLAWQVASITGSIDIDTDLKRELQAIVAVTGAPLPAFPEILGYLASHLVIKPFYGKQALRDAALAHIEGYIELGPALTLQQTQFKNNGVSIGGEWVIGLRLWFTPVVSSRLELGQVLFLANKQIFQALHARIGISFNAGGDE